MRILRSVLLTFAIVLGLLLIVSVFLPSKIHVERSRVINAKASTIYKLVAYPKNWPLWSPWHKLDPNMELGYEGPESGKGARFFWKSEQSQVGNGSLVFLEARENEYLKSEMNFMENGMAYGEHIFVPQGDGSSTKVTWTMDIDVGWNPVSRYFSLFMDKMVGKDYEEGLERLDAVASTADKTQASAQADAEPQLVEMTEMQYIGVKVKCPSAEISTHMAEAFGKILVAMGHNGMKEIGAPFAIWKEEPGEMAEFTAAVFVDDNSKAPADFVKGTMRTGKYIKVSHQGPYETTSSAWKAAFAYMDSNQLKQDGDGYEHYITDPGTETDPAKIMTDIYIPVK